MVFHKETDFKEEPMIGKVASDWDTVKLEEALLLLRNGLTTTQNKEGNGYPVTRIETISEEDIDPSKVGYLHDLSENEINEYRLRDGDILFSHINSLDHIGKTAIYEEKPELLIHGMNLLLLRPDKERIHPRFLLYLLRLYRMKNIFRAMAKKAVNQASINQTELGRVKILRPPLDEQHEIVGFLGVVDLAVAKTDEVIAKTERLKKGLMQELLTKGIGHKEYRPTQIGEIPKEWDVVTLGDVCDQRNEMFQPSANNDYRFVGLEHIASGETRIRTHTQDAAVKSSKFKFYPEDILYGKLRPYLDKAVLVNFEGICSTDLLVLKPKERVLNEFLIYVLHSTEFLKHAIATTSGTNHPRTSWTAISKFKFGLPKHSEQQKIAETLSAVDKKIELEKKEKARLERVKRGLMDLLLTGKVRVKGD